ncbi:MAG: hypothetical protein JOY73_03605 [Actinobacteria bacterium]|nr:hypothetical protein [Actinomycetota bacterium]
MPVARVVAVVLVALVAAGAAGAARRGPCGTAAARARPKHVIWIWMENETYSSVIGNRSAPFLTQLARECGVATNYDAISHPSLPNYIAATSGGTWGIADDQGPASHRVARASIFSQLTAAGLSWRSYEESMPVSCDLSDAGEYAVKHNPAAYYTGIRSDCRKWDVPFADLEAELASGRLPSFSFVTPNLCDDAHSCPLASGDAWLRLWVARIVDSPSFESTVLFVTFDEGSAASNRVPTVVVSPSTRPGTRSTARFDHYSLLRTTEQLLGLHRYLAHAGDAASMRAAFHL